MSRPPISATRSMSFFIRSSPAARCWSSSTIHSAKPTAPATFSPRSFNPSVQIRELAASVHELLDLLDPGLDRLESSLGRDLQLAFDRQPRPSDRAGIEAIAEGLSGGLRGHDVIVKESGCEDFETRE